MPPLILYKQCLFTKYKSYNNYNSDSYAFLFYLTRRAPYNVTVFIILQFIIYEKDLPNVIIINFSLLFFLTVFTLAKGYAYLCFASLPLGHVAGSRDSKS